EGLDGAEEAPPVGAEHDEVADGEVTEEHAIAADEDHVDVGEEADGPGEGEEEGSRGDGVELFVVVVGGGLLEAPGFLLFAGEDFYDDYGGQVFLESRGDVAEFFPGGLVDGLDLGVEVTQEDVDQEEGGEGGAGDDPVHAHDDDDRQDPEQAFGED